MIEGIVGCPLDQDEIVVFTDEMGWWELADEMFTKYINAHVVGRELKASAVTLSNVPITTVEDYKGIKYRSYAAIDDVVKRLGASPVVVSHAETYTALQLGTVDAGKFFDWKTNYDMAFYEVAKYAIMPNWDAPMRGGWVLANWDAFNSLPPDLQKMLIVVARDYGIKYWTEEYLEAMKARKLQLDYGLEEVYLTAEAQAEILKVIQQSWADFAEKSEYSAKVVNTIQSALETFGYSQ